MYWQSIILVLLVLAGGLFVGFWQQGDSLARRPSFYDPGLTIEQAAETSEKPLLVEFYSDTCATCQRLTPLLHQLYIQRFQNDYTLVMLNTERPENRLYIELFQVETIPALFVFQPKKMKKTRLNVEQVTSVQELSQLLASAVN